MIQPACFLCVIYLALCLDVSGAMRLAMPLAPQALDIVFLGLLWGGRGLPAVSGAAATSVLSALVLGTNPGLATAIATTFSVAAVAARRRNNAPGLGRIILLVLAVVALATARGMQLLLEDGDIADLGPRLSILAGSGGVTVMSLCFWMLATEFCGWTRNRDAFET